MSMLGYNKMMMDEAIETGDSSGPIPSGWQLKLSIALGLVILGYFSAVAPRIAMAISQSVFSMGNMLASGVLLAASVSHQLPDAQAAFKAHANYPWAGFICGLSFASFLLLEEVVHSYFGPDDGTHEHYHDKSAPSGRYSTQTNSTDQSDEQSVDSDLGTSFYQDRLYGDRGRNTESQSESTPLKQATIRPPSIVRPTARYQSIHPGLERSSTANTAEVNEAQRGPSGRKTYFVSVAEDEHGRGAVPLKTLRRRETAMGIGAESGLRCTISSSGSGCQTKRATFMRRSTLALQERSLQRGGRETWLQRSVVANSVKSHHHEDKLDKHLEGSFVSSIGLLVALSVHGVLEGLGLGLLDVVSAETATVAILAHKLFAGYALGSQLTAASETVTPQQFYFMVSVFAFSTPIGIVFALGLERAFHPNQIFVAVIQATVAGTFLYISLFEVCMKELLVCRAPEFPGSANNSTSAEKRFEIVKLLSLLVGFSLMSLLAFWA
jgi:hypothetical protein